MRSSTLYRTLRLLALTAAPLAFVSSPAQAGDRVEITPTIGYRAGSIDYPTFIACILVIGTDCPERASVEDSATAGLLVDIPINRRWMFELRIDHQSSDVDIEPIRTDTGLIFPLRDELEVITLTLGVLRSWTAGRTEPFVAFGAGIARTDPDRFFFGPRGLDGEHLALSAGGGVKLFPDRRFGLRLEARGLWIDLPSDVDNDIAVEATSGLIIRF